MVGFPLYYFVGAGRLVGQLVGSVVWVGRLVAVVPCLVVPCLVVPCLVELSLVELSLVELSLVVGAVFGRRQL